jgi:hypothetical protein
MERVDGIRCLHEHRMTLYNIRREHEWRIFFGVVTLLGALDLAGIAYHLEFGDWKRWAWCGLVSFPVVGWIWYEVGLQHRNFLDRTAMNTLYNELCDAIGIQGDSPVREGNYERKLGLWAFWPKMTVLLTIFFVSIGLPWLGITAPKH